LIMKGYILLLTSGILFFIIAAVTVLHMLGARSLKAQYANQRMRQEIMDQWSLHNIIGHTIHTNESTLSLPDALQDRYTVSNTVLPDQSVLFSIQNTVNDRITTLNVQRAINDAFQTQIDVSSAWVSGAMVQGIQLNAAGTQLVGLRALTYPFQSTDRVIAYALLDATGEEWRITPNVPIRAPLQLPSPYPLTMATMTVYFSALSEAGVISLYFTYSDGSIQNALIEY
jgi:hypothetical protein